jgi:hypothetical protein
MALARGQRQAMMAAKSSYLPKSLSIKRAREPASIVGAAAVIV